MLNSIFIDAWSKLVSQYVRSSNWQSVFIDNIQHVFASCFKVWNSFKMNIDENRPTSVIKKIFE